MSMFEVATTRQIVVVWNMLGLVGHCSIWRGAWGVGADGRGLRKGDTECLSRVFVHQLMNQIMIEVVEEYCSNFGLLAMTSAGQ